MAKRKAFLVTPFHLFMDASTGKISSSRIKFLQALISAIESHGYSVCCAHEREGWGANQMSPEECTSLDFDEFRRSDLVIAIPGQPPSGRVHIEIGWASALGKRVLALLHTDEKYSKLMLGLQCIADVHYVWYSTPNECCAYLEAVLAKWDGQAGETLAVDQFYDRMAQHYDDFMEDGESLLEDEVALVVQTFSVPCELLDVGCGTGRVSAILAARGYWITGIDISSGMLGVAITKGIRIAVCGDFAVTQIGRQFDGIISLHAGFSYTDDRERMKVMVKNCWAHLRRGGKVIWDTPNAEHYGKEYTLEWPTGSDVVTMTCYGHLLPEIEEMFSEYFKLTEVWGSYTPLRSFEPNMPRIIIVGEKRD